MTNLDCLTGWFRRFRSKILGREVEIVGQCSFCGRCCRELLLRDQNRWLRRLSQYEALVAVAPEFARFQPTGRNKAGFLTFTCSMLEADGCCSCYDSRPTLCRNYPTKSLYYQGGRLSADCGYDFKVVTFRDVFAGRKSFRPRIFSRVLQQKIEQEKDEST